MDDPNTRASHSESYNTRRDIMHIKHMYEESNEELKCSLQKKNIAFIVIGPDAIQRGLVSDLIEYYTQQHKALIIGARFKYLSDYELELFYRYTFRERIIKDYVSYWWLINRGYNGFPCLALMLYCEEYDEETFCETILRYKGSHTVKCAPVDETVRDRFGGIGPILSVVHSSDDFISLQREALLFFSTSELELVFSNKCTYVSPDNIKIMIKPLLQDNFEKFRNSLLLRISSALQVYYPKSLEMHEILNNILTADALDSNTIKTIEYNLKTDARVELYFEIIKALYATDSFNFGKDYKHQLRRGNLLLSDWEEVLLLNYMQFYGKTHQKVVHS